MEPSPAVSSIANTDLCTNELPGVIISIICLFTVDIRMLSIQFASGVAANGHTNFFCPVVGSVVT